MISAPSRHAGVGATLTLIVVASAMLVFALWRVPYDDEWFSITLARDTTWQAFWRSLASDNHPPYVALLDRGVVKLTHSVAGITAAHLLATIAAALVLMSLARSLDLSRLSIALALLHPIVFMYGGAARWYPFAFLADALRAWALWARGSRVTPTRRTAAFLAGAALGVAAGYVEVILVGGDMAWIGGRALSRRARAHALLRKRATRTLALAALAASAVFAASPIFRAHASNLASSALGGSSPLVLGGAPVTFLGFGLLGEALPPPPWTLVALFALPGYLFLAAHERHRRAAPWLGSVTLSWLLGTLVGIWHPRYALFLWVLLTAHLLEFVREPSAPKTARMAAGLTCAWLSVGLVLTLDGRSFVKGDLNRMPAQACAVVAAHNTDLVVAPYPRTAMQIERTCKPTVPIVTAGWIRHYEPGDSALVAPIARALPAAHEVALVTVPTGGSSLTGTFEMVLRLLDARCTFRGHEPAAPDRFAALKRNGADGAPERHRYDVARYTCQ